MSKIYEALSARIRKQDHRDREEGRTFDFHSRGYHRYFEGYTEVKKKQPNGKVKIERIYTGLYHTQQLSGVERIGLRILYALLWGCAVLLFIVGASADTAGNRIWYVTAVQTLCIVGLGWVALTLVSYLTAPRRLTIYEYRTTSCSLRRASVFAAACQCAAAVLTVVHYLLTARQKAELISAALLMISGLILLLMHLIERHIPYEEEYSDAVIPDNGIDIC